MRRGDWCRIDGRNHQRDRINNATGQMFGYLDEMSGRVFWFLENLRTKLSRVLELEASPGRTGRLTLRRTIQRRAVGLCADRPVRNIRLRSSVDLIGVIPIFENWTVDEGE